jgi:acylglycerol lipase
MRPPRSSHFVSGSLWGTAALESAAAFSSETEMTTATKGRRAHARNCLRSVQKSNRNGDGMHFDWRAPDGELFPCEEWLPRGKAIGTLICAHGLSGAATDFLPLGQAVSAAGVGCFALNLRGQGSDPLRRRRGALLDVDAISKDIAAFTEAMHSRQPGTPLWVCGESMGALILASMLAYRRFADPVSGAIFSAPVVALIKTTPWTVRQTVRVLALAVPRLRFYPSWFISGKLEPLQVTRDQEHAQRVQSAPYYIKAFTFRFLHQLGKLIESSEQIATKIAIPCLVLAAGRDVFVRPEQVRAWFDSLSAKDKTFRLYPEAFHLLWNDWDKEAVLTDILAWLNERSAMRLNI